MTLNSVMNATIGILILTISIFLLNCYTLWRVAKTTDEIKTILLSARSPYVAVPGEPAASAGH